MVERPVVTRVVVVGTVVVATTVVGARGEAVVEVKAGEPMGAGAAL